MKKNIRVVEELESILREQFLNGAYHQDLPLIIEDVNNMPICTVYGEDSEKWMRTPYEVSFAKTNNLCTKEKWEKMNIVEQIELCDCWYALAVSEYLEPALDDGKEFELE